MMSSVRPFTLTLGLLICACGVEFKGGEQATSASSQSTTVGNGAGGTGATGGQGAAGLMGGMASVGGMGGVISAGGGGAASTGGGGAGGSPATTFGVPAPIAELNRSDAREDDPTLPADLLEIYFNSDRGGAFDVWKATRTAPSQAWSTPQQVAELSSVGTDTAFTISPDGLTFYLSRSNGNDFDIYVSTRPDRMSAWSLPVAEPSLNSTSADFHAMEVTPLQIFLASERTPTTGVLDLFASSRAAPTDAWGVASNLGAVNSPSVDEDPWVHGCRLLMFFSSSRPNNTTNYPRDIYMSTRATVSAAWGAASAVDELNTPSHDQDPWLSPDSNTVFFSSDRDGTDDLFVAKR